MKTGTWQDGLAHNIEGQIAYNRVEVNEGNGFNKFNGRFTAPVSGIYAFTFSGISGNERSWTVVNVYKNNRLNHEMLDGNKAGDYNNIGESWIMKLRRGDQIYLEVAHGKLSVGNQDFVHFTGQLLKADD